MPTGHLLNVDQQERLGSQAKLREKAEWNLLQSPEAQIKNKQTEKPERGELLQAHSWFSTQEIWQILKKSGQESGVLD